MYLQDGQDDIIYRNIIYKKAKGTYMFESRWDIIYRRTGMKGLFSYAKDNIHSLKNKWINESKTIKDKEMRIEGMWHVMFTREMGVFFTNGLCIIYIIYIISYLRLKFAKEGILSLLIIVGDNDDNGKELIRQLELLLVCLMVSRL